MDVNESDGDPGSKLDALRRCEAFDKLDDKALGNVGAICVERDVPAGEEFITVGMPADFLALVATGSVAVYSPSDGEELLILEVFPGGLVGETEYFEERIRIASARAIEDATLLILPYGELAQIFEDIPHFYQAVVSQSLSKTQRRLRESVERRHAVERSLKHLSDFLDLSGIEAAGAGSEALIRRIVHMASKVMKSDRASLFLVDNEAKSLWSLVAEGHEMTRITVPFGSGIAGWVAEHRTIQKLDDVYSDDRFDMSSDQASGYRTKSMLCGPIFKPQGELAGVIQVINRRDGAYDDNDVALFKAFAHQAGVAVENYELCDRLVSSNQKLAVMLDVLDSITRARDLPALIDSIVTKTTEILQCERASFFLYDFGLGELWSVRAIGSEINEIRFPASEGIGGFTAVNNVTVKIDDAYADPRFNRDIDQQTGFQTRNLISAPVTNRDGEVQGVLQAINKASGAFSQEDEQLVNAIASQLSEGLKKMSLLTTMRSNQSKLLEYSLTLETRVNERSQELRRQVEALQESIRQKDEHLGMAAHDLRAPVANILAVSEFLVDRSKDSDPEISKWTEAIATESDRLYELAENLLSNNALEEGRIELAISVCDLRGLVEKVVARHRIVANSKRQAIHIQVNADATTISADESLVIQVLENLVSNAIKYSPLGETVEIMVDQAPDAVQLTVQDSGPGISEEDQKRLFERFQRSSAKPTGSERTVGLGLSIVKRLMDLMGGTVWCENAPGGGARLCARFKPA